MNKAILIGRITKDIELNKTNTGISVARFTLAVNRHDDTTDFLPVVVWRLQAENCAKYLAKGSKCAVIGSIQTRSYEKNGEKRYVTEIVADNVEFLEAKATRTADTESVQSIDDLIPIDDGEIPF